MGSSCSSCSGSASFAFTWAGVLLGMLVRRKTATSPGAHRAWIAGALVGVALVIASYAFMAQTPLPDEVLQQIRAD